MALKNIIVILFLFCISYISAEPNYPDNTQKGHTLVLTVKRGDSHRPGKPSNNIILSTYENGVLVFDANFEYEYISVSVIGEDNTTPIEGTVTPLQPYIITPASMIGEYSIQCTTDGGAVYEGTITL